MISNFYVVALSYKLIPLYLHTYEYIQKCKALKEYPDNEMRSQLDTTSEISLKWLYSLSVYITDKVHIFFFFLILLYSLNSGCCRASEHWEEKQGL